VATRVNRVSAGYFATLGIRPIAGRTFTDSDAAIRPRPIVVSQALANVLWPGRSPLGTMIDDGSGVAGQIVGIVADVPSPGSDPTLEATAYEPRLAGTAGAALFLRVEGDPAAAARAAADTIRALDPNALGEPRTLLAVRQDLADRFMRLVGIVVFLGAVAVGLAAIGLYGVAAFAASRRTKEMGIRIALGATRFDIVRSMLAAATRPMLAGLAVGVLVAVPAARALEDVLPRTFIDVRSPTVFAASAALLAVIATAATFGPARRAAGADPIQALRED
jgi:hypothetical protein